MKKLAIISTHPIQYYAPLFRLLQERRNIEIKVFYTWGESSGKKHDPGFNKEIEWDIPLLEGYPYQWVKNIAKNKGSHHFMGIINPFLICQLTNWQPDALLIYGWAYYGHLKAITHFKSKIPVFLRGDSTLLDRKAGIRDILKNIFLKWVYKHVDHAFYVGSNNKKYFMAVGLKDNQLTFAPHAIDNMRFSVVRFHEALDLRLSLKIKEEDIIILFAGKFEPVKNVNLLLSAFLNLTNEKVHLLLVGNGPGEKSLKQQSLESGKNNNVHFLDFQNQRFMPVIYQVADLFCLPSRSETWGLSLNEAMACGLPLLAAESVGAAADLVKPAVNGLVFLTGSETDLTEKLNALVALGKSGLREMGKFSAKIIEDFNFEKQAVAIESVINR